MTLIPLLSSLIFPLSSTLFGYDLKESFWALLAKLLTRWIYCHYLLFNEIISIFKYSDLTYTIYRIILAICLLPGIVHWNIVTKYLFLLGMFILWFTGPMAFFLD